MKKYYEVTLNAIENIYYSKTVIVEANNEEEAKNIASEQNQDLGDWHTDDSGVEYYEAVESEQISARE